MAVYGYDRYGAPTTYGGASFASSGFDLSPISIQEDAYGVATLRWTTPDATVAWSRIRIVRNQTGVPVDETDGLTVREILPASPSATHTDFGLTTGVHYYYGFFVETDVLTYSVTTTYNKGQVAKSVGGTTYVSIVDGNVGVVQTDTAYWAPTNLLKRWVLAGQAVLLTTKRFEHTSRLYTSLPMYYRKDDVDWAEPAEADKAAWPRASYPALAKYLSIFGMTLDGLQTKYENIGKIQNPHWTPAWYLDVMANHLGLSPENSASSRLQRVRLKNAALLARSRGSLVGLQDEVTASLGYDAVATVGTNKVLTWDQADARFPEINYWDPAMSYVIGDLVRFGGSGSIYRAIVANRGTAQGPPNGGSNTWWEPATWYALPDTTLYVPRYASKAGWIPADRTFGALGVLTGASSPVDASSGNVFRAHNFSGSTQTINIQIADRFYAPAYGAGTQYVKGELVTSSSMVWEAVVNSLGVTPGTDAKTWRLFYDRVPNTPDPQAIFENAIPVTPSASWTFSYYVATVSGLAGASAVAEVSWYTSAGVFISTSTGTSSAITGVYTRRTVTATTPANAKYAILRVSATSVVADGKFIFRGVQMEQAAAASTYTPPRQVTVLAKPTRVNYATNPSFETDASGWTAFGTGVTLARTTATFNTGVAAGRITFGSAGTIQGGAYFNTPAASVVEGETWTVSGYLRRSANSRSHRITLGWYTAANALIGSVVQGTFGSPSNTVYDRYSVTATAPATASYLRVTFGDVAQTMAAADFVDLDSVLIEKTPVLKDYFDGSTGLSTEYFWAGTAHLSRSFYYQGYGQRRYRLNDVIKRSIPHGVPFTTRYADV